MILACFGIAGLGPAELSLLFSDAKISHGIWLQTLIHKKFDKYEEPIPVIFHSAKSFVRRYRKLPRHKQFVAFVIDSPLELGSLHGAIPLGYEKLNKQLVRFTALGLKEIKAAIRSCEDSDVESTPYEYKEQQVITQVVSMFKDNSVLPALQTLLYKIKNKENRVKTFALVKKYLGSTITFQEFQKRLRKLVDQAVFDKYTYILEKPEVKRLRTAVVHARENPLAYKRIALKYKVSDYDTKYLLKTTQ